MHITIVLLMKDHLIKSILGLLTTAALSASLSSRLCAADYFISPKGDDAGKGTVIASPWVTIEKVVPRYFEWMGNGLKDGSSS